MSNSWYDFFWKSRPYKKPGKKVYRTPYSKYKVLGKTNRAFLNDLTVREKKFHDYSLATVNVTDTGQFLNLTSIGQNVGDDDRIANKITLLGSQNRFVVKSTGASCVVRLTWIIDRQQINDTDPTIAEVFGSGADIYSNLNPQNIGRFKVLKDMYIKVNDDDNEVNPRKVYINLGKVVARYNGNLGADISKNGLYLIYWSDKSSDTYPTLLLSSRTSFSG